MNQLTNANSRWKVAVGSCTPGDVTWGALDAHCVRCGARAKTAFEIRHILSPVVRENRYVWGLGSGRMTVMVDAKGRPID